MAFRTCRECGKRYYRSRFDTSEYRFYCNLCGFNLFQRSERAKEEAEKMVQFDDTTASSSDNDKKMGFPTTTAKPGGKITTLKRTDNDEDYLDSTRCEYSKTEVEEMKTQLQQLMFRKSNIKQTIRKLYDNINICDEKIEKIKCKLAIADREQHLRKKLRRETRELIPTLENVQKQTTTVYKNINDLLDYDSDDDCIIIKNDKNNIINE